MLALTGAKVVAMVCAHMRGAFMEHRKALKNQSDVELITVVALETRWLCSIQYRVLGVRWYD